MTINHELCSELLGPFLRGELDDARRREVEAHVASCTGCREELRALKALEGSEVEPLSELESARLRRDVWAAVGPLPRSARKPLGARLVPYLGTAAVLALFAVGAVTLSGDGADERAGDAAQVESLDAVEDRDLDAGGAEEAGADTAGDATRALQETAAAETAANEAGSGGQAGPEDESVSAESGATLDALSAPLFSLGCSIGVGAP